MKYTGTLDSTCTITIAPNSISKTWYIENGTSGSQSIIISQGSGANVTIPTGQTKVVYSDGAGSGAAMGEIGTLGVTNLNVSSNIVVSGTVDGVDLQTLNTAVTANTAKTGITSGQANAITANTAKTGITSGQASAITANTSKTTNATHSGEVTGSGGLTIANNVVDEANLKVSNGPTNGYALTAQSGNTGGLTWALVGASTNFDAVGTYALLYYNQGSVVNAGTLLNGNAFFPASATGGTQSGTRPGSWRCMGYSGPGTGTYGGSNVTTWVRVS